MWSGIKDHLPQAGLVVLGALLGIVGTAIVFYTEIKEDLAKYDAKIEHNERMIERILDAHGLHTPNQKDGE